MLKYVPCKNNISNSKQIKKMVNVFLHFKAFASLKLNIGDKKGINRCQILVFSKILGIYYNIRQLFFLFDRILTDNKFKF